MVYECQHCFRTFATPYALKRHISNKYQYIAEDEGETSQPKTIDKENEEDPNLWDDDEFLPTIEETDIWGDDEEIGHYDDDIPMVRLR